MSKQRPVHGVGTYANAEKGIVSFSFQLDENNADDMKIMEYFGKFKVKTSIRKAMLEMIEKEESGSTNQQLTELLKALPHLVNINQSGNEQSTTIEEPVAATKKEATSSQKNKARAALGL